jgi:transposase-like protein
VTNEITNPEKEDSRMEKKIAPSERKAQELHALLQGQLGAESGQEFLSTLVRLATERVLQEALESEQAMALGRERYERGAGGGGYRNGYENGTLKTAEGVLRVQVPQIRGREEPYRSALWGQVAKTSEVLKRLIVEMYAGGLSQGDIEYSLEKALGQFVLSRSAVSEITCKS